MPALSIQVPFPIFNDRDGHPLDNGYVWIGVPHLPPQTNPVSVYFDEALTQIAQQPLRTINGYVSNAGTPAQVYIDGVNFSILVQDRKGTMVYNFLEGIGISHASRIAFTGFKGQVGFVSDLADADGSDWIGFDPASPSAIPRSAQDKLREIVSVKDFGAKGDGVTDDSSAVSAMIAEYGFARFTAASYTLNSVSIDAPVVFDMGAYLTANSGHTVTFYGAIESPRQWIFRGPGDYVFAHDANSGENARQIHASWFGAFPSASTQSDCSAALNKLYAAVGNLRESVVMFDMGSYWLGSGVTVTRGAHTKGAGTRRTVFRMYAEGFDAFTTSGVAAKFSDIQFENTGIGSFAGAYIRIAHSECEVYDTNLQSSTHGIYITGANCRVDNIMLTVGDAPAAGSSAVRITSGGCSVSNIMANTSAFGPDAIVHIGGSATVANIKIENISTVLPSIPVLVDATAGSVVRVKIDGIGYEQSSGTAATHLLKFISGSTYILTDVVVNNIVGNSYSTNGIRLEQNSSGVMEDISFDNITISGSAGNGFEFVRTAGTLRDVRIGTNVDVSERATPYYYSGVTSGFKIEPNALPNTLPAYCYDCTIADDGVAQINLNRSVYTGWLMVSVANAERAIYTIRSAPTPSITAYGAPSANMATATTALTGTTGTDTKFTIGVTDGVLYAENRLGASQRVCITLMTGVS